MIFQYPKLGRGSARHRCRNQGSGVPGGRDIAQPRAAHLSLLEIREPASSPYDPRFQNSCSLLPIFALPDILRAPQPTAIIHVGSTYSDLGATIERPQADLNRGPMPRKISTGTPIRSTPKRLRRVAAVRHAMLFVISARRARPGPARDRLRLRWSSSCCRARAAASWGFPRATAG